MPAGTTAFIPPCPSPRAIPHAPCPMAFRRFQHLVFGFTCPAPQAPPPPHFPLPGFPSGAHPRLVV